ncbi:HutD family protein [Brevibacterium litoralis]|uniref:HutD family protein n=1 Tax=Brevibacterium litoralis TaxID=3138935 RepID=UPI0032EB6141
MRNDPPSRVARRYSDLEAKPWVNGLGETVELVDLEASVGLVEGADAVMSPAPWRLSVARLLGPADFSALPGLHRTFVPVGSRVVLRVDGTDHVIEDRGRLEFDGSAEVTLVDLDRECRAVNLMSRSGARTVAYGPLTAGAVQPDEFAAVALDGTASDGSAISVGEAPRPFDLLVRSADGAGTSGVGTGAGRLGGGESVDLDAVGVRLPLVLPQV